jgi:DNA-binding transcriptional MerR regulator
MSKSLTIGAVADRFGVAAWQVRRLYERGILPPADRVGPYRVIDAADLPKVGAALRQAGYLGTENAPIPQPAALRPEEARHA